MKTEVDELLKIKDWAFKQHDVKCNQKYDEVLPYSEHLKHVAAQARRFKHLWPETGHRNDIYHCCFCHDLIEDARVSYNDIKNIAGGTVAEVTFLLTENKGRTRVERHNESYYLAIAKNDIATFVKLCDITANVLYSTLTGSSMLDRYRSEYHHSVKKYLWKERYSEMFEHLEFLLK